MDFITRSALTAVRDADREVYGEKEVERGNVEGNKERKGRGEEEREEL